MNEDSYFYGYIKEQGEDLEKFMHTSTLKARDSTGVGEEEDPANTSNRHVNMCTDTIINHIEKDASYECNHSCVCGKPKLNKYDLTKLKIEGPSFGEMARMRGEETNACEKTWMMKEGLNICEVTRRKEQGTNICEQTRLKEQGLNICEQTRLKETGSNVCEETRLKRGRKKKREKAKNSGKPAKLKHAKTATVKVKLINTGISPDNRKKQKEGEYECCNCNTPKKEGSGPDIEIIDRSGAEKKLADILAEKIMKRNDDLVVIKNLPLRDVNERMVKEVQVPMEPQPESDAVGGEAPADSIPMTSNDICAQTRMIREKVVRREFFDCWKMIGLIFAIFCLGGTVMSGLAKFY